MQGVSNLGSHCEAPSKTVPTRCKRVQSRGYRLSLSMISIVRTVGYTDVQTGVHAAGDMIVHAAGDMVVHAVGYTDVHTGVNATGHTVIHAVGYTDVSQRGPR